MSFEIYNKRTGEVELVSEMEEWLVINKETGLIKYDKLVWPMEYYAVRFY